MKRLSGGAFIAGLLSALVTSGFSFMVLEILFLRELLITLGGAIYASSAMLGAVMLGLFLGSQIFGYLTMRLSKVTALFIVMELCLAGVCAGIIPVLRSFGLIAHWPARYIFSFIVIMLPSVLVGGEIPVAMQMIERYISKGRTGFYTGLIYGADTMGALIGALLLPFALLPELGAYKSSLVAAAGELASALIIVALSKQAIFTFTGGTLGLLIVSAFAFAWSPRLDADSAVWAMRYRYKFLKSPELLSHSFQDSIYQRIQMADIKLGSLNQPIRVLFLDGLIQSSTSPQRTYQEMIYFGLTAHPNPKHLLFIGCGDGDLIAAALADPRIESIDQVDIDRAVIETAGARLPELNHVKGLSIWDNPKVHLAIGDGRQFIRQNNRHYDLIFSDLPDASQEGSGIFYSVEFMQEIHRRLNPGGIYMTHDYLAPEVSRNRRLQLTSLVLGARTLKAAFGEYVYLMSPKLWPNKKASEDNRQVTFLMASKGRPIAVDEQAWSKRFQSFDPQPQWFNPERLKRWLDNSYHPEGLDDLPVSTDDRPVILHPRRWSQAKAVLAIE